MRFMQWTVGEGVSSPTLSERSLHCLLWLSQVKLNIEFILQDTRSSNLSNYRSPPPHLKAGGEEAIIYNCYNIRDNGTL